MEPLLDRSRAQDLRQSVALEGSIKPKRKRELIDRIRAAEGKTLLGVSLSASRSAVPNRCATIVAQLESVKLTGVKNDSRRATTKQRHNFLSNTADGFFLRKPSQFRGQFRDSKAKWGSRVQISSAPHPSLQAFGPCGESLEKSACARDLRSERTRRTRLIARFRWNRPISLSAGFC